MISGELYIEQESPSQYTSKNGFTERDINIPDLLISEGVSVALRFNHSLYFANATSLIKHPHKFTDTNPFVRPTPWFASRSKASSKS